MRLVEKPSIGGASGVCSFSSLQGERGVTGAKSE